MTTEQQLDQLIATLPKELAMPSDQWTAIAARLENTPQHLHAHTAPTAEEQSHLPATLSGIATQSLPPRKAANNAWYWLTGTVAAAVFVLVSVFKINPAIEQPTPLAHIDPQTMQQDARLWVGQLKQQREQLLARMSQQQLRQIEQVPVGFENWRQQLAIWQQASTQLEQALLQQPANRRLLRQYQQLQQQQLKYMHTLTSLSQAYS